MLLWLSVTTHSMQPARPLAKSEFVTDHYCDPDRAVSACVCVWLINYKLSLTFDIYHAVLP